MNDALDTFEPTPEAARARLDAVDPEAYARSRNHLDGAVTRLSPYITHGLLTLPQVLAHVRRRHAVHPRHRLVFELAWREYFRHAWAYEGDGILSSLHPGVLPDAAYARSMPLDVLEARTGVPAIDNAVRRLHACGWLHNHARLWLASYLVHGRKVHWRCGADWLCAHLLDGDLASNHLSWQWVAGTASSKPYLFNAENVARHAPPDWHSAGTPIDRSYEELDRIARTAGASIESLPRDDGFEPPTLHGAPPEGFAAPEPRAVQGRVVWIVHPWSLADPPDDLPDDAVRLGVAIAGWHARWPWSAARWRFVATRMRALCSRPQDRMWCAPAAALNEALSTAADVRGIDDPHLDGAFARWAPSPPARLFQPPARHCTSFSQFWDRATLLPPTTA